MIFVHFSIKLWVFKIKIFHRTTKCNSKLHNGQFLEATAKLLIIIVFVQDGSPTPHPFSSRPYFVCKFSRQIIALNIKVSNAPRNDVALLRTITYRAIKTTGTLIVKMHSLLSNEIGYERLRKVSLPEADMTEVSGVRNCSSEFRIPTVIVRPAQ